MGKGRKRRVKLGKGKKGEEEEGKSEKKGGKEGRKRRGCSEGIFEGKINQSLGTTG